VHFNCYASSVNGSRDILQLGENLITCVSSSYALLHPVYVFASEAPPQTIEVGGSAGVIVRVGSSS